MAQPFFALALLACAGLGAGIGKTGTLGHEVAEWINDPLGDNIVP
jgi:hypothetical protein